MRFAVIVSAALAAALLLSACSEPAGPAPQVTRPVKPSYDLVAAIRAAGDKEKSIIDVTPLRDPGVSALQQSALVAERAGKYQDAADQLDEAIKLSPGSPDLLQDRAEAAVYLHDYPTAEKLARQSWEMGSKMGSLCARNWQTVREMRLQADDTAGAATAAKAVGACHVAGVDRF
jgi:tetratricopeptide (TPR) repeat protein